MVAIRLARTGAKKKPCYRVVVMDKRRARDSRNIEIVGHYNPRPDPIELVLKRDRIDYWLAVGAQPSSTVQRLVRYFDEKIVPFAAEAEQVPAPEDAVEAEASAPAAVEGDQAGGDEPDEEVEAAAAEDATAEDATAEQPAASPEPPQDPDTARETVAETPAPDGTAAPPETAEAAPEVAEGESGEGKADGEAAPE